jgi:hypothetical protein
MQKTLLLASSYEPLHSAFQERSIDLPVLLPMDILGPACINLGAAIPHKTKTIHVNYLPQLSLVK